MSLPASILSFLKRTKVPFTTLRHAPVKSLQQAIALTGIAPERVARAVMVQDARGLVMAVLPMSHVINLTALQRQLNRKVEAAQPDRVAPWFADCEEGCIPPLGEPFGIETVIDESLQVHGVLSFQPGTGSALVRMDSADFMAISPGAKILRFARHRREIGQAQAPAPWTQQRIQSAIPLRDLVPPAAPRDGSLPEALPAMPEMARRILMLRADATSNAAKLASIVELDPSLSAQVIRYARSAFYNYGGRIDSIRDAIARVLGYDVVMNMALGIAAGRPFDIPNDGPLGLHNFWRHSVYSAVLCQALSEEMPLTMRPTPGMAYLAGLLHNFGFLLLAHMHRPRFAVLNRVIAQNPQTPIAEIEQQVLGRGGNSGTDLVHTELGARLMERWNMPVEVMTAVRHHHELEYRGTHATYANLVLLATRLVRRLNLGDAPGGEPPHEITVRLGLSAARVEAIYEEVLACGPDLDVISRHMAA